MWSAELIAIPYGRLGYFITLTPFQQQMRERDVRSARNYRLLDEDGGSETNADAVSSTTDSFLIRRGRRSRKKQTCATQYGRQATTH